MKKSYIKKLFALIIMFVVLTLLTGCGNDNKLIQGRWEVTEATYKDLDGKISVLEKNGTLPVLKNTVFDFQDNLTVSSQGTSMIWSYKYQEGHLEIEAAGEKQGYSCEYTGNTITLTAFYQQAVGGSGGTDLVTIVLQRV